MPTQLNPIHGVFQPEELDVLQEAFDAAWAWVQIHTPEQNDDSDLRMILAQRLMILVGDNAAQDPEYLIRRVRGYAWF